MSCSSNRISLALSLSRSLGVSLLFARCARLSGSYAPTKWAIRGFADCLRNELFGTGVTVSVAYPPDTETPGYATETELKSELCVRVNNALGSSLYGADKVAAGIVRGIVEGRYHLAPPDFGSTLLVSTMASLTRPGVYWMLIEVLLAPLLVLVKRFLTWQIDGVARTYWREREERGDDIDRVAHAKSQ